MKNWFKSITTNWKTTLVGVGAAALQLYAGGASLESAATAAGLAALGAVAKDAAAGR